MKVLIVLIVGLVAGVAVLTWHHERSVVDKQELRRAIHAGFLRWDRREHRWWERDIILMPGDNWTALRCGHGNCPYGDLCCKDRTVADGLRDWRNGGEQKLAQLKTDMDRLVYGRPMSEAWRNIAAEQAAGRPDLQGLIDLSTVGQDHGD